MDLLLPETAAAALTGGSSWWDDLDNSTTAQDRIYYSLAALYGLIGAVALIQLIRIEHRVPEFGWTTQKVFFLLNFLFNAVRSIVFALRRDVQKIEPEVFQHVLLDLPGLAFFTTYVLLVLFWAEIYYQARAMSTDGLRPTFYMINGVVYSIQIALWLLLCWIPIHPMLVLCKLFFSGVSLLAAFGFALYGGRLFMMLRQYPAESKGRANKMKEVASVATICFACFLGKCIMMCFAAFYEPADVDVTNHAILNFAYYLLLELVPSALILIVLRKLPARQVSPINPLH
ncbi:hypothetical protein LUZ61_010580 [Rhynchospora tenuis]|uniref:THH1/TOM1/TOM3 domain-containing protein n=1 Tax=Rhynchospora tenuis TaxID=198213 RepID=A0AAD5ZZH0_9POAL|nr:hypothetical protein LUZ61_010580 [Rhynchospora tenuis]